MIPKTKPIIAAVLGLFISTSLAYANPLDQCPDTGETKVIKPHTGSGYWFYRLIGNHSFKYFLDGSSFNMNDRDSPGKTYFFIDKLGFEVMLIHRDSFMDSKLAPSPKDVLLAQAKYEQAYFKENMPEVQITNIGFKYSKDTLSKPSKPFYLWKQFKSKNGPNSSQFLLSTMLDNFVVVVLSILPLKGSTEIDALHQVDTFVNHFDHLSSNECQQFQ
jgi:hypothetical protein